MKRARWLLLFAFAISLLVHALVALVMHPTSATQQSQKEVFTVVRRSTVAVAKRPPSPPPHPARTPSPFKGAPHPRSSAGAVGPGGGAPAATPAPPVPTAAPSVAKAGCTDPNAPAAILATPAPPDIPLEVRAQATTGDAVVSVQLDLQGQVLNTSVAQSTGNSSLDLVAVAMARDARYAPALRACKPVAAVAVFSVKFVAW